MTDQQPDPNTPPAGDEQPPTGGATPPANTPGGQETKQVPITELHREREKRQGIQAELDALREQVNQVRYQEPGHQFGTTYPQQPQQPQPQQGPANQVQQLDQLWEANPRTAVQTEIQMALDWYDRVNSEVNTQMDQVSGKHADFKNYAPHVRSWVNRLPAAQRAKPGIVELAYNAIKGQNIDTLIKEAQDDAVTRFKAGDFGSGPQGGNAGGAGGSGGSALNEQERAAAAAMGVTEEDYLTNRAK